MFVDDIAQQYADGNGHIDFDAFAGFFLDLLKVCWCFAAACISTCCRV